MEKGGQEGGEGNEESKAKLDPFKKLLMFPRAQEGRGGGNKARRVSR